MRWLLARYRSWRRRDRTFADRLLAATGNVLRIINRSSFDLQWVLDAVTASAAQLTEAERSAIFRVDPDGARLVAQYGLPAAQIEFYRTSPPPLTRGSLVGRVFLDRRTHHVSDFSIDKGYTTQLTAEAPRSAVGVPLLRDSEVIGVLTCAKVRDAFADREIELLTMFADQAAIAIENARLVSDLQDRTAQLAAASRHKSEFLANMSHELRTPLNAIIGFTDVVLQRMAGDVTPRQHEYLTDVLTSSRHLLSLINDILDLSKVEAGKMDLELGRISLPEILRASLLMVQERAARHGIALVSDIQPEVETIPGDERKLKQVLLNLLSNAVKFTPDRGRIDVSARLVAGEVNVTVRDTGVGIASEDLGRIFEEFEQAKHGVRAHEGTGLGLTLTRRIIELHGGRIWVESEVGKGTAFTFALPAVPTDVRERAQAGT